MIPTGFGRAFAIVAILGFVGYLFTGSAFLGILAFLALVGTGLHWAFNGGWGEGSYASRANSLPRPETTLGGQPSSAGQWVWYVVGLLGLVALLLAVGAITGD